MATKMTSVTKAAGDTVGAAERNALRMDILKNAGDYVTSGGSSNAYTLALDAQIVAYVAGDVFKFKSNFANTGSCTVNVNSIGALTLKTPNGATLPAGAIGSGQIVTCIYDGTDAIVTSVLSNDGDRLIETVTFGENVDGTTTPQACYLKASDGKVYRTDADAGTESTFKFIGFTKANNTTNNTGPVIIDGVVDGFPAATFTTNSDIFLSDTAGAVSHTPSTTNFYKVSRALSATALFIEKGRKMIVGSASLNTTSAANNDLTIDCGFRAQKIKIFYHLQGHGSASGSAKYEDQVGEATWYGSSLKGKRNLQSGSVASGSDGADIAFDLNTNNTRMSRSDYTDTSNPVAGTSSGTGAIQITLSVNSITDTSVVLRRATVIGSSPNTARCDMYYEIDGA